MKYFRFIILSVLVLTLSTCKPRFKYPFLNPHLPVEERVDDLLSRMSLQQKVSQLNYESAAIDSLGIPEYNWWNECLHGVARSGLATVFPQAIGMAASFDTALMAQIATVISDEARAKYHGFQKKNKRGIYQGLTFWTPNINIFRDPRWGRGMETYGEDPFLSGSLAVAFIRNMQGNDPLYFKTIVTSKHFAVHSGPEPDRHTFNANVSDIDLRETYLPAFRMTIEQANVQSVMCAYNRFRDKPCCGNSPLLNDILRNEWKFNGYVVSDCWAIQDFYKGHNVVQTKAEAAAMAFRNGTDLNCGNSSPALTEAVQKGFIKESEIDTALKRLLRARFKLGMFDPQENVPFSKIALDTVDCPRHKELAKLAALKSIVLLKNDGLLLPLDKTVQRVAVIGPNANDVEVLLGNYNGIPSAPVTPLQGIRNKIPHAKVSYALGCEHADNLPTFEVVRSAFLFTDESMKTNGLLAEYFDTAGFSRKPVFTRIDSVVDFIWHDKAPADFMDDDNFAVRWSGVIVPPVTGQYALGAQGMNRFKVYLGDSVIAKHNSEHHGLKNYSFVQLEKGKPYRLKVEFSEYIGDADCSLLWAIPGRHTEQQALDIARDADIVILFMGLSPRLEGEEMDVKVDGFKGGDRMRIDLPDLQQRFIKKVHALGKPTVLVLLNGSALAINWEAANISAIVEAWYPGQAAGDAIADVLFGDYNPAGRLPVTFYKALNDLPPFDDYNMKNRTYRYFTGQPLFPFGFGLSYTSFEYSDLKLDKNQINAGDAVKVSVTVENTGGLDGEEVVQLYVRKAVRSDNDPVKSLKQFKRVAIARNQKQTITFLLDSSVFQSWNEQKKNFSVMPGDYEILIGSSSADNDLKALKINIL